MNRIINWGLIGLGNASLNLAKEFNKINNSKLVAVASLTKEKRDYFSSNFNFDKKNIYSDYEKILKNKLLDIVYIGLPNSMHEELCLRALDNNKNVLIEKPITTNLKSFNKIKKKFYEKKLLIQEGTANKFHPFYKQVLNYFKTLEQSKIIKIKSSFGNDALGGKKFLDLDLKELIMKKDYSIKI
jgi:predicted dehydrogenase